MSEDRQPETDLRAALRIPAIRAFVLSRTAGSISVTLIQAAVAWQVYAISNSALQLGLIGLVRFVPALGMSLIGGAVADSYNRRNIILMMSILLLMLPSIDRIGRALLLSVAAYGIATMAFGSSRSFVLSLIAFTAVGMADQVSVITRTMTIQFLTPDELRGRVSAVNSIFISASNQLGAVESGFVAALTNATFSVVSGGLGCLAVVGIVAARVPALRNYRTGHAMSQTYTN